ncbi:hypothetical protein CNMCM8980_003003 [Aspergillus fumigatiaffinis]|uniref:Uncharacterized protein n=1 Tax=Aspergillus fumigatiaffinis TaxID=340414 RepID=A0A8H4GKG5_9EURO|nr:hypothetical protein CNMCM5878_000178 [Aspergillus fumigatiaffinis]KAF4223742.1 hypothetical protein CNMCM6457_000024 [Aspergillus fumigatiaffinis]KAF4231546.1 hypothetical protein CNMCM6805_000061 [Aspergillus fumigatiaffinis]KAF4236193.1 hypothetical protein CNMCM8980_003003 [Aspergillus fumigatiaffinis]
MGTTSVRRNLFHHNLSRRPVSATPGSMPSGRSNGISGPPSHMLQSSSESMGPSLSSGSLDNGDIVVRDKNGSYKLDIPVLPPAITSENGDGMDGLDEGGTSGGAGTTAVDSASQTEISGREKEKIEASLAELMYRNRNRQMSNEPAEILNLIHQSLRSRVAALEEDNWMYEPEVDLRA